MIKNTAPSGSRFEYLNYIRTAIKLFKMIGTRELSRDHDGENFYIKINDIVVCELNLWEESFDDDLWQFESRYWLNGIETDPAHFRNGYATKLIKEAIKFHGKIFISSASPMEHKDRGDSTARELTEEGAKLVKDLVKKGIVKREWVFNPFGSGYA